MSGPSGESCKLCYYCADPGAADEYSGICRRYPTPTTQPNGEDHKPWVSITSWCGEFKLHPRMQRMIWKRIGHQTMWDDEP